MDEPARAGDSTLRPCLPELFAIIAAGVLHVVVELSFSLAISRLYNAAVAVLFLGYAVWRIRSSADALHAFGLRVDNLVPALLAHGGFVALAVPGLVFAAPHLGEVGSTTSASLPGYLVWGIAQQFALQNLLARNLFALIRRHLLAAALVGLLFGAVHFPRTSLMVLAAAGGFALTLIYRRFPNVLAVGIAHGLLGWVVFRVG